MLVMKLQTVCVCVCVRVSEGGSAELRCWPWWVMGVRGRALIAAVFLCVFIFHDACSLSMDMCFLCPRLLRASGHAVSCLVPTPLTLMGVYGAAGTS